MAAAAGSGVAGEGGLQALYRWVDAVPLSRPRRNIARDFSDGVLVAEVVKFFFPAMVQLHSFVPASSTPQKLANWSHLNSEVIRQVVQCRPGVVEQVLLLLRQKIEEKQKQVKAVPGPGAGPAGSAGDQLPGDGQGRLLEGEEHRREQCAGDPHGSWGERELPGLCPSSRGGPCCHPPAAGREGAGAAPGTGDGADPTDEGAKAGAAAAPQGHADRRPQPLPAANPAPAAVSRAPALSPAIPVLSARPVPPGCPNSAGCSELLLSPSCEERGGGTGPRRPRGPLFNLLPKLLFVISKKIPASARKTRCVVWLWQ
ncbi:sperm flagellar protein 1 isoform X2 [Numida meleagris]|uniref:sperm flagellar protein 1 isoform X2 n=1 Tax=Numida meleagris TaxID=8996 RepID=UPI000B3E223A|nr:sperm flagellar protein 1 isoform X2 [Numida meleagris]